MRLLGAGAILREVEAGAELLAKDFGVTSEIWSVTSFTELRRDGLEVERWNMLHPEETARVLLCRAMSRQGRRGRSIAATDYIKAIPDGIRPYRAGALQGARHGRLRPLGLSRARCARSSRSTAITSRSRR